MVVDYPPNCQPIVSTNNTSDLVKRLKALSEALQNSDTNEESKTPNRYRSLATHLSDKSFLDTSSKDVQIWLACCLADIFRVFAPEIPFGDPAQLREVLIFMIRSLKGLDSPSGPLFRRYFYLLENVYACNTLQLTLQLPGEEACVVIKHLIKTTMDIVNGKEWTRERESSEEYDGAESVDSEKTDRSDRKEKMHHLLLTSITKLLSDVDQITIPVLDTLFFYLINPQKSNYRESYYMARNVIQGANTSLDGPVENLLTRSLLVGGFLEECEMVGSARQKLYDVIIELHEAMPSLVVPVIPQVGNFLKDPDLDSRLAAMKAVSVMVQNPKSRLYEDYPEVWQAYLERRRDANVNIRCMFAKKAMNILLNNSQLRGPICDAICRLLNDPEDDVRCEALYTAIEAARRKLDSVNEGLIMACCEKMCDAKSQIRQDAISKLLQLHAKVIMGEEYTVSDRQVVSIIPTYAFRLYMKPDTGRHEKIKIERLFSASIVPYKLETDKRIRWMVELHEKLGRIEGESLVNIVLRNAAYRRLTREILFVIKSDMDTEKKGQEIDSRIERMSREQPCTTTFTHIFRKLTNLLSEDQKAFENLYHTVGSDYTCTGVEEAVSGFLASVIESKKFTKEEITTVRHFVERVAPLILDKEGAEILVQIAIKADGDLTCKKIDSEMRLAKILQLLHTWADAYPHAFSSKKVVDKLIKLLGSDNHKTVEVVLRVFLFIGSQQKSRELAAEWMDEVMAIIWDLVTTELPGFGRVAKLAVRVLCKFEFMRDLIGEDGKLLNVANTLVERLDIDHPACENALRALSVIHLACKEDFHARFPELIPTIVVPLVLAGETDADDPQIVDLYAEDMAKLRMPKYTPVKVHAMKFLARSLTGHADQDALAVKSMKLFISFIEGHGAVHDAEVNISPLECLALRATAGSCVLRMSYLPKYLKMLTPEKFLTLSALMTDSADCVRRHFADRLFKGIRKNKLVVEFIALFALPALLRRSEEEQIHKFLEECRSRLKMGILRRVATLKLMKLPPGNLPFFQPEYAVAYSTFLLAMQPILTSHKDVDNLAYLQECMWFLMEPFVQSKTHFDFELMYRSLQEVRQSKSVCAFEKLRLSEITNKEYEETNMKMWALADLALCMMVYRAKIEIKNLPGETMLVKFFKKMRETNDPVYAPEELIKAEQERHGKAPKEKKGMNGTTTNASKANRTKKERAPAAKKNTTTTRKPAQKKQVIIEDDDEDENEESDEEEVMPAPSRRRGLAAKASTSNGSPGLTETRVPRPEKKDSLPDVVVASSKGQRGTAVESPKSLKKRSHAVTLASTSGAKSSDEPADKKTRLSLENLPFSPIVRDPAMPKRGTRGFVSSTPIVKNGGAAQRSGRRTIEKLDEVDEAEEDEDKEEVVEEKETKKRGRTSRLSAGASASKVAKTNDVPDSDEEEEAKEEEQKMPVKRRGRPSKAEKEKEEAAKSGGGAGGRRGGKKSEPKKPDSDSEDEETEVKKTASPKKTNARKTTSRGSRKTVASQKKDSDDEEESKPPKKTRRTNESQKTEEDDDDEVKETKKKPAGRGRGRITKSASVASDDDEEKDTKQVGRGRAKKSASVATDEEEEEKDVKSSSKGRGRPRKSSVVTDEEEVEEEKEVKKSPKKAAGGGRKTAGRKSSPEKKEDEKKPAAGRRGAKKNEAAASSPTKKTSAGKKGAAADTKKQRKGSEPHDDAAEEKEKPKRGRPFKNAEPKAAAARSTRSSQGSQPSSPTKTSSTRSRKKLF